MFQFINSTAMKTGIWRTKILVILLKEHPSSASNIPLSQTTVFYLIFKGFPWAPYNSKETGNSSVFSIFFNIIFAISNF